LSAARLSRKRLTPGPFGRGDRGKVIMHRFAAAAVVVAALGFAAPAGAVSLTFNVDVTSASGVDAFVPFSFQETWTFTPNPSNALSGPPFAVNETWGGETPTVTDTPMTASLQSLIGVAGATPDYPEAHFNNHRNYDSDGTTLLGSSAGMTFGMTLDSFGPGESRIYHQEITLYSAGFYLPATMDLDGLVAFLQAEGPAAFTETAYVVQFGDQGVQTPVNILYSGVATLVGAQGDAVPEPATWALMLAGFGLAGVALRGRRGARAA
jgi:hypothetical protein